MSITNEELLSHVDHTLLKANATYNEIKVICEDAIKLHTASVCIPPNIHIQANIIPRLRAIVMHNPIS